MDGAFAPTSDRSRLLTAQDGVDYHQYNEDRLEAGMPSQQNAQYPLYPSAASAAGYAPPPISGQEAERFARSETQNFVRPTYVVGMNPSAGFDHGVPFAQVPDHTQQFVFGQVWLNWRIV
jgi:hypothetical protein